ncbi:MAG TPA: hypothetical protein VGB42_11295 [Candidatus Thermoplasmatota archaeon]
MTALGQSRLRAFTLALGALVPGRDAFAAPPTPVEAAERAAQAALALMPTQPAAALAEARRALSLTSDFEPTAFVRAGRKGEVVEDEYIAAREAYRAHRARLYEAVGLCLAASGDGVAALRYLRRATDLDPSAERATGLARTLLVQGRGRESLLVLESAIGPEPLAGDNLALLEQAVDLVGLPSVQGEIDRIRLRAVKGAEPRDGPFPFPPSLRLSTSPIFRLDDAPVNILYQAEGSCRACSSDLGELKRIVKPPARVLLLPESLEHDRALRQVVDLYRYGWPLLLGRDLAGALGLAPRSVLVTARGGWVGVVLPAEWRESLTATLPLLGRSDLPETVPRTRWNHVKPLRGGAGERPPGLLPEGIAPGEDMAVPPEFAAAVEAYRAGRFAEALRLFDDVANKGDGFLLPPEARLNRALCLAGLSRREEARRLLLKTGDSRFQEDVDRALEAVASPRR